LKACFNASEIKKLLASFQNYRLENITKFFIPLIEFKTFGWSIVYLEHLILKTHVGTFKFEDKCFIRQVKLSSPGYLNGSKLFRLA